MSENGEVFSPKEEAQIQVERLVNDIWYAVRKASELHESPAHRPFFSGCRQINDITETKTRIDLLLSAVVGAVENGSAA